MFVICSNKSSSKIAYDCNWNFAPKSNCKKTPKVSWTPLTLDLLIRVRLHLSSFNCYFKNNSLYIILIFSIKQTTNKIKKTLDNFAKKSLLPTEKFRHNHVIITIVFSLFFLANLQTHTHTLNSKKKDCTLYFERIKVTVQKFEVSKTEIK